MHLADAAHNFTQTASALEQQQAYVYSTNNSFPNHASSYQLWKDNSFQIQTETKTNFLNLHQADQLSNDNSFQIQAATKRIPKHASSFQS